MDSGRRRVVFGATKASLSEDVRVTFDAILNVKTIQPDIDRIRIGDEAVFYTIDAIGYNVDIHSHSVARQVIEATDDDKTQTKDIIETFQKNTA